MSNIEIIKVDKCHRIKVIHDEYDTYIPQRKGLIFWHDYKVYNYDYGFYQEVEFDSSCDTIEEVIEFMIEEDEKYGTYCN